MTTIISRQGRATKATTTFTTLNLNAMKKLSLLLVLLCFSQIALLAQKETAYFTVGNVSENLEEVMQSCKESLTTGGFKIIGEYKAAASEDLAVICYTSPKLEEIALSFKDRGALAATLKVGFRKEGNNVKISMLNPMYLFYAYFTEGIEEHEKSLLEISNDAKTALKSLGSDFTPFGGELEKKKLQKYHYKVMMPYFEDAVELKEFNSFEEGLKTIQKNLEDGVGETQKVYQLFYKDKEVAVFGVALNDKETGEGKFLPIIGEDHVAALPYEIILQGKTASILHGKYRIALHWPELTMGTFMKIMSTPGDIKSTLEALTEE